MNVIAPAEVIETFPPFPLPVFDVPINPPTEIDACVVESVNPKLPVMVELNVRAEDPVWVKLVAPSSVTAEEKVALDPCVVLVPLRWIP